MQILAEHKTPGDHATRAGAVQLINRGGTCEPFVTCWRGDGDDSWCWGHYFQNESHARADYQRRVKRGY